MSTYKNIAVAGANGNFGPTLVKALVSAGFNVTILSRKPGDDVSVKTLVVDYNSHDSIVGALKGQDAMVCALPNHGEQPSLIDACIAAGVKRYIASEFGSNVLHNSKTAALPVFKGKAIAEEHLKKKQTEISWTAVVNGGFLDWGVKVGFLVNVKGGPTKLIDGGDSLHSMTTLGDAAQAVVGILQHPSETQNRAVFVQSAAVSQNQLLSFAKEANPAFTPNIKAMSEDDLLKEGKELFPQRGGIVDYILASLFCEGYGNLWSEQNDNKLLGISGLSEQDVKNVVAQYV